MTLDEVNTTIYQPQRSDYHRGHRMDFHIVKMYKDMWSKTKMSKIFFLSMCGVKMFLTFTSLSLVLL